MKPSSKVEFGDFQTPPILDREVCELLHHLGECPEIILEPTAGRGCFLVAAATSFPDATLRGWGINSEYVAEANRALNAVGLRCDMPVRARACSRAPSRRGDW